MNYIHRIFSSIALVSFIGSTSIAHAQTALSDLVGMTPAQERAQLVHDAVATLVGLRGINPSAANLVASSSGLVVFPRIARSTNHLNSKLQGRGVVFIQNRPVGVVQYDGGSAIYALGLRPHSLVLSYVQGSSLDAVRLAGIQGVKLTNPDYQVWAANTTVSPKAWAIAFDGTSLLENYVLSGTIIAQ